jgi:enterochelin esterase-like enzyme
MEMGSLPVDMLPEPLDFRVYLPPCYEEQPGRRYPVLYLIHGQSSTDDQWDRLGADETAEALIAAGEAPPFLIVMPRDRRWSQPDEDRFGQAVVEALIPWIDAHYHTLPEREFRAIGGLSRGAGWAVHLALSRWQLFSALGAHSLPVFWIDTYHIKEWLSAIPPENMPRIYMDNPNNDRPEILNSSIWFEKLLTQRGIPHEWHLFTGYHDENYWQAHVEQYLRWYVEPW